MKSKENKLMLSAIALAVSSAISAQAFAEEVEQLDKISVEETKQKADDNPYTQTTAPYKANFLSDSKRVRPIAETPQTMTVITKEAIQDSGKNELKDILSAQPGITLGTGEGGNSFGDRYIIRGYEARSDVFTDGLREPGLISRETFALEQIEITKGPSSTFAGRGSTGGAVNSVTKKATLQDDFTTVEAGVGMDSYKRFTLDANKALSDDFAIRFNALYGGTDVPDREPAEEDRKGALLSAVYSPTTKLDITADYYHFRAKDKTDPGVALDRDTGEILAYEYVGQKGLDFHNSDADIFTAGVKYAINDDVTLENKARIGQTKNDYIISTYSSRSNGTRTFTGFQENDYFGNQTNLIIDKNIGGKRHTIVTGIEYAKEELNAGNYIVDPSSVEIDPYNPDNNAWSGTITRNQGAQLELKTVSAYLMDTVTLSEDWEVFAGVRYDSFDYSLYTPETERRGEVTPAQTRAYDDGFFNGHVGLVFSPWENGNIYASWSTSSNINGGEVDAAGSCGYGGLCVDADGNWSSAEPEETTNLEIGTKWTMFNNDLLLTAAVFQITKDKVIEGGVDSYSAGGSLNTGKNRVEGVELGLSGNLTDKLSGQMGVTMMNSETLESYFDGTQAVTGRRGVSYPDYLGLPKANFSKRSASAQLKYQATDKFAFGGNLTYASEFRGGQPDTGASADAPRYSGYVVYDAFASYKFTPKLSVRANVLNVFDKEYYTAGYRGGSIVYLGDARTANVNLTYKF
jgi:catecholate siderophore receptor